MVLVSKTILCYKNTESIINIYRSHPTQPVRYIWRKKRIWYHLVMFILLFWECTLKMIKDTQSIHLRSHRRYRVATLLQQIVILNNKIGLWAESLKTKIKEKVPQK